jgi:hypothetical protein
MPLDYNHEHENEITLFAETNFRNARRRFGIKTDDRRRHMYIIGKTGMGKTTLMENMVLSDILAGHGVCYIDPHGDTAEKLLDYVPSHRINDVVYFNPADFSHPVGFNILESVEDDKKHLVRDGLMGVFKKIWPDVWSARMEYILQNTVQALLDYPGATLLGINRMLVDAEYRKRVVASIKDPVVKTFWVAEFSSWSEKYATEAIAPVQNKVGQFLSASIVRNIVAQVKSTIDLRTIMDQGKILIVNLSKGRIGEDNMRLLGGMLITKLQMAAMERVDIPEAERRDFYLFVDEFQNFANESFASILSEARKYRLCLTVAHQYIMQLDEKVAAAIFGNVGTLISFRVGGEDATFMEKEFMPTYLPEDLLNLTKFQVYLKLMVDGVATSPFSANTLSPIAKRTGSTEKVIAVSRERYASPRNLIEEKVLRWSGMELAEASSVSYPAIKTDEERMLEAEDPSKIIHPEALTVRPSEETSLDVVGEMAPSPQEFLKISPERLAAIVKPPAGQQKKKDKPKFSHTCSRCGKVWDMPIQLDPSRPMFCSECMPLVREERKQKQSVIKDITRQPPVEDEKAPPQSHAPKKAPAKPSNNRPRLIGTPKQFPTPKPVPPASELREEDEEDSLLGQILKAKGKPLETNKQRLTHEDGRPAPHASTEPEVTPKSTTVFRQATSSVNYQPPRAQLNPLDKRKAHGAIPQASGQTPVEEDIPDFDA